MKMLLAVAVIDPNLKGYGFTARKLRYLDGEILAGGGDQALLARFRTQAVLDTNSETARFFRIDNSA